MSDNSVSVRYDAGTSRMWSPDPDVATLVLGNVQTYVNDLLRTRGHVFVNDVLDQLGITRTVRGVTVGWLRSSGNPIVLGNPEMDDKSGFTLVLETDGVIYTKIEDE